MSHNEYSWLFDPYEVALERYLWLGTTSDRDRIHEIHMELQRADLTYHPERIARMEAVHHRWNYGYGVQTAA